MEEKIIRYGVSIPETLAENFDKQIVNNGYANRSEAIRDLMRKALVENEWESDSKNIVATLTIVYDHKTPTLMKEIKEHGHEHIDEIISMLHIHLDAVHCLEVYVMKGDAETIKHIANGFIGKKGVKHGKLVCTTSAENIS